MGSLKARRSKCERPWSQLSLAILLTGGQAQRKRESARPQAMTLHGRRPMIIPKRHLSRRTFLRGAFGATIALPMLDAMAPALTAQSRNAATTPFRFGTVYFP